MNRFTLTELRALYEVFYTPEDQYLKLPATPSNCKLVEAAEKRHAELRGLSYDGLQIHSQNDGSRYLLILQYVLKGYMGELLLAQTEKLEARASEWVALLEPQLQPLGDSSSTEVIGEVQGAKEDEDIAEEVVTRLEARYGDKWLVEARYHFGYHKGFFAHVETWFFKFTRKSATTA